MNWRTVDKQLGCCILCRGVVGFVFKFCSNRTNFDFSTYSIFNAQGWCSVRARKVSEMVLGPTSLSLTLICEPLVIEQNLKNRNPFFNCQEIVVIANKQRR